MYSALSLLFKTSACNNTRDDCLSIEALFRTIFGMAVIIQLPVMRNYASGQGVSVEGNQVFKLRAANKYDSFTNQKL